MDAHQERELCAAFDRDGFVAMPGFLDSAAITELRDEIDRFISDAVPGLPNEHVFYEDKSSSRSLKQIQQLWQHDDFFQRLMIDSPFYELAERLLDGPVVPKNMQYFNKPPAIGQATPPHQDGYYFKLEPCAALTMWLALDPADDENGCVRYVRGSNLRGMRAHGTTGTLGFSQGIVDFPKPQDEANEVAYFAEPGDLLVHHALTIHRAGANNSVARSRRAIGFIYYSATARENADAAHAYQQSLVQRLSAAGKI